MSQCEACDHARTHPKSGRFNAQCDGCAARSIAQSPDFHEAARQGNLTPRYRMALQNLLPKHSQAEAHRMVKDWIAQQEA